MIWKHERMQGYIEVHLLGSDTKGMLWNRMRLSYDSFRFLVSIVEPFI